MPCSCLRLQNPLKFLHGSRLVIMMTGRGLPQLSQCNFLDPRPFYYAMSRGGLFVEFPNTVNMVENYF